MPAAPAILVPPDADLLDAAAAGVIAQSRAALPDLSHLHLLLPSAAALRPLRLRLVHHAGGALLGPQLATLPMFAARGLPARPLSALDCRLLLARELENFLHLFPGQDALALAEEFFALFEQLSAQAPQLAEDPRRFAARVEQAYGARLAAASQEAQIVHTLWRAFLQQTGARSPAVAQAAALRAAFDGLGAQEQVHLIGFDDFSAAQAAILRNALAAGRARLWLHGRLQGRDGAALAALCEQLQLQPEALASGDDARSTWLDAVFATGDAALRDRMPATAADALPRLQAADDPEHEARLADLAIRRWLLEGRREIAVVAQDRRYARRLRALLERAGIALRDEVGWALSTSTAAASLVHWLDCCEQNFAFRPLLDLLKSPFHDPAQALRREVQAFEHAIRRSRTVSGLAALTALCDEARALLRPLEAPYHRLAPGAGARPAQYWCENLLLSLQALPLWTHWQQDAAGRALAQTLDDLHAALRRSGLRLPWSGFRRLLERALEQATFAAEAPSGGVRLLTPDQAQGLRCDALILAGAAAGRFPGRAGAQALFSEAVRAELGLPHWTLEHRRALARFRLLLQAAPQVLVTWAPEEAGDEAQPCAWVEVLQACGAPAAPELAALAGDARVEIAADTPLPAPVPPPRPAAGALPAKLSASAHQQLIDCPYQFHAAAILGLRAPEEPDEPYDRADYGEQVHAILAAFEQRFGEPVTAASQDRAQALLREIAQASFAPQLRSRALAQAWLAEFLDAAPLLAGWMAARSGDWPQVQTEQALERELAPGLLIHGRADRLERNRSGEHAVVDYKTGQPPKAADIHNGEKVQATHYALAADACVRVEYLAVRRDDEKTVVVDGDALMDARIGVRDRLRNVYAALRERAPLPAHGDAGTCERCDYHGLCRKGAWADG